MSNKWEYKECFIKTYMEEEWSGHYEVTNGDIVLCTIDDPEDITETENTLQHVANALNNSGCKFYVNTAAETNLHNENMLLRMALEQIRDSPVPSNEAEAFSWVETATQLVIDALKTKTNDNGQQDTGTNKG